MPNTPIPIGSNRQLLLDRRLIDDLQDARQVLHQPVRRSAHRPSLGRRRPHLLFCLTVTAVGLTAYADCSKTART